ncbi:MAG: hypothetical protein QNJ82_06920 [Gammaproteobacteria bacterium]|nr:hypothetical protein [Gammaproteobacteria bacterium]
MIKSAEEIVRTLAIAALAFLPLTIHAECRDAVVMVHGNTDNPDRFTDLKNDLIQNHGYSEGEIFLPSWGRKEQNLAGLNDHDGSKSVVYVPALAFFDRDGWWGNGWFYVDDEEAPVRRAIEDALAASCSGKIDIVAHSMGNTLAAKQVIGLEVGHLVEEFVGVAGAFRGLNSCSSAFVTGMFAVPTCSARAGLAPIDRFRNSLLESIQEGNFGQTRYAIYSNNDEIICVDSIGEQPAKAACRVGDMHSSVMAGVDDEYVFDEIPPDPSSFSVHFGLLRVAQSTIVNLVVD